MLFTKNNGTVKGKKYFSCGKDQGLIVRISKVRPYELCLPMSSLWDHTQQQPTTTTHTPFFHYTIYNNKFHHKTAVRLLFLFERTSLISCSQFTLHIMPNLATLAGKLTGVENQIKGIKTSMTKFDVLQESKIVRQLTFIVSDLSDDNMSDRYCC